MVNRNPNATTPADWKGISVVDGDLTFDAGQGTQLNTRGRRRLARALKRGEDLAAAGAHAEAQGGRYHPKQRARAHTTPSAQRGKW